MDLSVGKEEEGREDYLLLVSSSKENATSKSMSTEDFMNEIFPPDQKEISKSKKEERVEPNTLTSNSDNRKSQAQGNLVKVSFNKLHRMKKKLKGLKKKNSVALLEKWWGTWVEDCEKPLYIISKHLNMLQCQIILPDVFPNADYRVCRAFGKTSRQVEKTAAWNACTYLNKHFLLEALPDTKCKSIDAYFQKHLSQKLEFTVFSITNTPSVSLLKMNGKQEKSTPKKQAIRKKKQHPNLKMVSITTDERLGNISSPNYAPTREKRKNEKDSFSSRKKPRYIPKIVVIDGANVALCYGRDHFSFHGIIQAIEYWKNRECDVVALIPQPYFRRETNQRVIQEVTHYLKRGLIAFTPSHNNSELYILEVK